MFHLLENSLNDKIKPVESKACHSHAQSVELPELFTNPFDYVPHPLVEVARKQLCAYLESQHQWHDEINQGKMFGVLVVENERHEIGFLAAFSGYLAKQNLHQYFVPPILNLLEVNGFFKLEEANISNINNKIAALENNEEILATRAKLRKIVEEEQCVVSDLKTQYAAARSRRRELRADGCDIEKLNAESQRQKGNIRRQELLFRNQRRALEEVIEAHDTRLEVLLVERQTRSAELQRLTFSNFQPLNAKGERRSILSIFADYNNSIPPAGSGECAAPKLLHYAFGNSLRPIAMGEFWWGISTSGQVRKHLNYYPACRGKCHPILTFMLQGLKIEPARKRTGEDTLKSQLSTIYEDDHIVVFNKPSGLPSVRGLNHTVSVQSIVEEQYPALNPNNLVVHRLDMDTSGIIIFAKNYEAQLSLQQQFANHSIRKRYIALLDGIITPTSGSIKLPLALDPLDRPRQRVDYENGKPAYTHYSLLGVEKLQSRVALYPQTGRTHQLRVHCAHHDGLATPIVGDRLYGNASTRLMLHAEQITLLHPATGRKFTLNCAPAF